MSVSESLKSSKSSDSESQKSSECDCEDDSLPLEPPVLVRQKGQYYYETCKNAGKSISEKKNPIDTVDENILHFLH